MSEFPSDSGTPIDWTEKKLFALYARYPEISFDPEDTQTSPTRVDAAQSSPLSVTEGETTNLSNSTTNTTPLRHPLFGDNAAADANLLSGYIRLVRNSDLNSTCLETFVSLGHGINKLAQILIPSATAAFRQKGEPSFDYPRMFLQHIQTLSTSIHEQIGKIARLKSLTVFKVQPTDQYLWTCYRQRAQMIIEQTSLPSKSEATLIRALAQLYDTLVYNPIINASEHQTLPSNTVRTANRFYNTIMTWQTRYTQWCDEMKDLRETYMLPLITRIHNSEQVLQEVRDLRRSKQLANQVIGQPDTPGMLPVEESVVKALGSRARKVGQLGRVDRVKVRFKREHTI